MHDYLAKPEADYPVEVKLLSSDKENNLYVFGVEAYIRETKAPDGYTYEKSEMPMYMCFVATKDNQGKLVSVSDECYNDLFFVIDTSTDVKLTKEQFGPAAYVVWGEGGNERFAKGYEDSYSGQYRIVDYPMQETLVRVSKYGYEPTEATLNLTGEQLNAITNLKGRVALSGVTMTLEKYDGQNWNFYNYLENKNGDEASSRFITRADGSFIFAKGLAQGTYRITETNIGSDNAAYEMAYSTAYGGSRVFTVGQEPVAISMYNPVKSSIELVKKDTDNKLVNGATFTLTPSKGKAVSATTKDGKALFSGLATDTYTLSESATGLTIEYLDEYLAYYEAGDIIADAGNRKINIGYEYVGNDGAEDTLTWELDADIEIMYTQSCCGQHAD